ncbi:hypothetical protein O181_031775 [Austropuccinia psidii MF-1]|uniref:RRM domain-containing protein n=1 Tax=Austropuccinia psidii MF-1 TaxID=1389203 RepID=A0A9Q3CYJ2_9BASI|nr:hypothetical protein [Austropuccinia psidii MF-1]
MVSTVASESSFARQPLSDSRLYVGNLSPAVDEFALVALFSKFGRISKLDFLFHKSGVLRGKPRGYAFIEMNRRDEALKAMIELNNKPVRGRRILVTPANESQYQEHQVANDRQTSTSHWNNATKHDGRPGPPGRSGATDPTRPTTLSILKSQQQPKGVNNKIAALEAKLASMQQPANSALTPSSSSTASSASVFPNKPSFLPQHPQSLKATSGQSQRITKLPHLRLINSNSHTASVSKGSQYTPSTATARNTSNLDAIGLTLKEQLKRNRESQAGVAMTISLPLSHHSDAKPSSKVFVTGQSSIAQALAPHLDNTDVRKRICDDSEGAIGAQTELNFKRHKLHDETQIGGLGTRSERPPELPAQDFLRPNNTFALVKPDLKKISWSAKKKS